MRRLAALASLAVMAAILIMRWRRVAEQAPLAPPAERSAIPAQPAALPAPPAPPLAADLDPIRSAASAPDSRFLSVPWTLDGDAPTSRSELAVRCQLDADLTLDRVDAQETPTQVFVTALALLAAPAAGPPAVREQAATVALSGPLGTRELIHAPVDARDAGDVPAGAGDPPGPPL